MQMGGKTLWEDVETSKEHERIIENSLPQFKSIINGILNSKELWLSEGVDSKTRRFGISNIYLSWISKRYRKF